MSQLVRNANESKAYSEELGIVNSLANNNVLTEAEAAEWISAIEENKSLLTQNSTGLAGRLCRAAPAAYVNKLRSNLESCNEALIKKDNK